jgi:hypothetical protein
MKFYKERGVLRSSEKVSCKIELPMSGYGSPYRG